MICEQCKCRLEPDEEADITKLIAMSKQPPQICTECLMGMVGDWDEKRIDVIGSNGNDGLHYEH